VENITANIAIIGGGPAGLMAAQVLGEHCRGSEHTIHLYDAMPSVGRKFLLAGRGGLNITHAEAQEPFLQRFSYARSWLEPMLQSFGAQQLRDWVHDLGIETFVGTSQRVFPKEMKAAPLLRAWLHRLRTLQVQVHTRHRLESWDANAHGVVLQLRDAQANPIAVHAHACLLALGGASWPRLGSDGAWQQTLSKKDISFRPLVPTNCGFQVQGGWSEHLRQKFAGQPVKPVRLAISEQGTQGFDQQGEFVITEHGIEGSLVYAASRLIRERIGQQGQAQIHLDLALNRSTDQVQAILEARPSSRSLSNHLHKALAFAPLKTALLYELVSRDAMRNPAMLAGAIKALPLTLNATSPIEEAISCAGGVGTDSLDEHLMLRKAPFVFCAGEMLDWEAPTGGYLLTACLSSGRHAARGIIARLGL
jgi:uncharacterized flavoprotein (TIGR03862 family)